MIINRDKSIFYLLCLLTPFENTALAQFGGVFTAPLAIILIPLILWSLAGRVNSIHSYEFDILKFFGLVLTISFVNLIFLQNHYDLYFLVDRGIRFILIAIPTFLVFIFCARQNEETFKKGILLLFAVVILSYIINSISPNFVNSTSFIQYSPAFSPHRMRGFTLEASTFAFQLIIACLLFFHSKNIKPTLSIPILLLLCLPTTSKGGLITLIIASGLSYLICFLRITPVVKYVAVLLAFIFGLWLSQDGIVAMFATDVEKYNSVATRATIVLTAIVSLGTNPAGAGFFGYLPSIYENGPSAVAILDSLFPNSLNYGEVRKYFIVGTVEGVGTKSFLMDWIIFGGFIFLYYYSKSIKYLVSMNLYKRDFYQLSILIFLIISTSLFIPADGRYICSIALAYLIIKSKEA